MGVSYLTPLVGWSELFYLIWKTERAVTHLTHDGMTESALLGVAEKKGVNMTSSDDDDDESGTVFSEKGSVRVGGVIIYGEVATSAFFLSYHISYHHLHTPVPYIFSSKCVRSRNNKRREVQGVGLLMGTRVALLLLERRLSTARSKVFWLIHLCFPFLHCPLLFDKKTQTHSKKAPLTSTGRAGRYVPGKKHQQNSAACP
ncbi:hypothetical protein ACLOJK_013853 [Asimina triloba]